VVLHSRSVTTVITIITMVLSLCLSNARVHPVYVMISEQRQGAANLRTKPIGLSHKPACRLPVNYTHHRHLLLLSPKADTDFTIP